ncbi:MAG: hypothetical protein LH472_07005 [Pyrinomonadaceae bacterium]|nr:hypothetical protein [Pyrinomonadaceae bacterium]
MEIFIIGLAVVALMVFVSTKIKKSAAAAYDSETVETEEFKLFKPEGFIYPLNDDSGLAFVANSKDWGKNEASKFRQARAALRVISNSDFKIICENAKKSAGKIKSKNFVKDAPAGQKIFTLEGETLEDTVKILTFWKIVESRRKIYELRAAVIENYAEDFADKINEMTASFTVK